MYALQANITYFQVMTLSQAVSPHSVTALTCGAVRCISSTWQKVPEINTQSAVASPAVTERPSWLTGAGWVCSPKAERSGTELSLPQGSWLPESEGLKMS